MNRGLHWVLGSAAFALMACSGANGGSGTSSSALANGSADADGGLAAAMDACLMTYVSCLRENGASELTCKAALKDCAESARPPRDGDGGACDGDHGGGGPKDHGGDPPEGPPPDADGGDPGPPPEVAACIDALTSCAATDATAETCVSAADACLAATRPEGPGPEGPGPDHGR